jgi:hypothetical protein
MREPRITLEELIAETKKHDRIILKTWHTAQEIARLKHVMPRQGRSIAEKLLRDGEVEYRIRKEPYHNTREYRSIVL